MTRQQLFTAFFFAAFFFLIYQLGLFLLPFAGPLFLAGVLVITFSPLTDRVVKAVGGSRSRAAVIMSFGVVALVLVPTVLLLWLLVSEASSLYENVDQLRTNAAADSGMLSHQIEGLWQRLGERFPFLADVDLSAMALEASHRVAGWIAAEGSALASSLGVPFRLNSSGVSRLRPVQLSWNTASVQASTAGGVGLGVLRSWTDATPSTGGFVSDGGEMPPLAEASGSAW